MTNEKHARETETLGQFLKRTRISQGFDLEQIAEDTRISFSNLKAMEADEYTALPAEVFCRGFYTIYAKKLRLDPNEVVSRYRTERGLHPLKDDSISHNPPAHKAAQQVSNMAEPSFSSPISTIGYVLLLLIILTGGICWYLDINPATFISEKLRSLQNEEAPGPGDVNGGAKQPAGAEKKSQGSIPAANGSDALRLSWDAAVFPAPATDLFTSTFPTILPPRNSIGPS